MQLFYVRNDFCGNPFPCLRLVGIVDEFQQVAGSDVERAADFLQRCQRRVVVVWACDTVQRRLGDTASFRKRLVGHGLTTSLPPLLLRPT